MFEYKHSKYAKSAKMNPKLFFHQNQYGVSKNAVFKKSFNAYAQKSYIFRHFAKSKNFFVYKYLCINLGLHPIPSSFEN